MFKNAIIVSVTLFAFSPAVLCAHQFSILNTSDTDLEIKLFHFEQPLKVWQPGIIKKGQTSQVVDITHGNRILVAKDCNTGKIVFTHNIKAESKGMKVLLTGSAPNIKHDITFTTN